MSGSGVYPVSHQEVLLGPIWCRGWGELSGSGVHPVVIKKYVWDPFGAGRELSGSGVHPIVIKKYVWDPFGAGESCLEVAFIQ